MKFWQQLALVLLGCVVVAGGICGLMYYANWDKVQACEELGGDLLERGFRCELPTGEIVNPVKYLESK